jgi:hypothetical protein
LNADTDQTKHVSLAKQALMFQQFYQTVTPKSDVIQYLEVCGFEMRLLPTYNHRLQPTITMRTRTREQPQCRRLLRGS